MEVIDKLIELQDKIEEGLFKRLTPVQMQINDSLHNSFLLHQKHLEDIVNKFKDEIKADIEMIKEKIKVTEAGIWSKWHLYALYGIIALLIGWNFVLYRKENQLEELMYKSDKKLELLEKIYRNTNGVTIIPLEMIKEEALDEVEE